MECVENGERAAAGPTDTAALRGNTSFRAWVAILIIGNRRSIKDWRLPVTDCRLPSVTPAIEGRGIRVDARVDRAQCWAPMKGFAVPLTLMVLLVSQALAAGESQALFHDPFRDRLLEGWTWLREDPEGWRITPNGLEIRVQPGNMWGPPNNARNVLVRPVAAPAGKEVEVSVRIEHRPTEQYEQVDLVWYYDDSHMVKLGQEMVDGKLSIVMGREENDRTRTIAIIPIEAVSIEVRLVVRGNTIEGFFRPADTETWRRAGDCNLPVKGEAKVSLQCYQGPPGAGHWARLTEFHIRLLAAR